MLHTTTWLCKWGGEKEKEYHHTTRATWGVRVTASTGQRGLHLASKRAVTPLKLKGAQCSKGDIRMHGSGHILNPSYRLSLFATGTPDGKTDDSLGIAVHRGINSCDAACLRGRERLRDNLWAIKTKRLSLSCSARDLNNIISRVHCAIHVPNEALPEAACRK